MIKKSIKINLELWYLSFCFIKRDIINKITEKKKRNIKSSLKKEFFKTFDEETYKKTVRIFVNNVFKYENREQLFIINIDKKNRKKIRQNSIQLLRTLPKRKSLINKDINKAIDINLKSILFLFIL